jgi:hypothetical protein
MPHILETEHFIAQAHDKPHHSRENGGHVKITPKDQYASRQDLPLPLATELIHLSMVLGEAVTNVMRSKGLDVVRINYQDNGNWSYKESMKKDPILHLHLYVRCWGEKHPTDDPRFQPFPEALVFPPYESGYYEKFQSLTEEDCHDIRTEFVKLLASEKYNDVDFSLL